MLYSGVYPSSGWVFSGPTESAPRPTVPERLTMSKPSKTASDPAQAASTSSKTAMIEAQGLSKYYGSFAAIEDVTFQVHQGEVVAFLGPNGAGKSTTMKLLTGYLAPSAGTARIAGHDMAVDRLAGSARLGYLPENGPLYLDMTPRSLLRFFADARGMSPGGQARSGSPRSWSYARSPA